MKGVCVGREEKGWGGFKRGQSVRKVGGEEIGLRKLAVGSVCMMCDVIIYV